MEHLFGWLCKWSWVPAILGLMACSQTGSGIPPYAGTELRWLEGGSYPYHTPDEIMGLLQQNKIRFQLLTSQKRILQDVSASRQDPRPLSIYVNVREEPGGQRVVFADLPNKKLRSFWDRAKEKVGQGDYTGAKEVYGQALKFDPYYFKTYTRYGESLLVMRDYNRAVAALREAARRNPIDWEAYIYLSQAYQHKRMADSSLHFILQAYVLARGESRVSDQLNFALAGSGRYIRPARFDMNFEIKSESVGEVGIYFDRQPGEGDMAFATCRALWEFSEPYRKAMLQGYSDTLGLVQTKECLLSMGLALGTLREKGEYHKVPAAQRFLFSALLNKYVNAIVLWEFGARRDPYLPLVAAPHQQARILEYLQRYVVQDATQEAGNRP